MRISIVRKTFFGVLKRTVIVNTDRQGGQPSKIRIARKDNPWDSIQFNLAIFSKNIFFPQGLSKLN